MTRLIALFPGQLSEKAGMGEAVASAYPYVADLFHDVERRSGVDLGATFFGDGSPRLHDDRPAQVGVFAVSLAVLEVLEREYGLVPAASAGYSLGIYAAAVASGSLTRGDALEVLLEVDRLLSSFPVPGAMGYVIGLSRAEIDGVIAGITPESAELSVANENAPRQFVLTGAPGAVRAAVSRAAPRALKAGVLPIAWPMHSVRLAPLEDPMRRFLATRVRVTAPSRGALFVPMTGGRLRSAAEVAEVLAVQIARPSHWEAAVRAAVEAFPVHTTAEVGPGDVLSRLCRWILRRPAAVLEDPASIGAFAPALAFPEAGS